MDRWWDRPAELTVGGRGPTGITGLGCDAYGEAAAGVPDKRRSLIMQMRVGSTPEPYLAHLLVRYGLHHNTSPTVGSSAEAPARAVSSPVLPKPFTQLPAVGAPLARPFFDGEGYRVAEGSAMVAPASPGLCAAGGFVAVIRAIDSAATVVERYAEQFRQAGLGTEDRKEITAGSATASRVRLTTAGGGEGSITVVTGADGRTYLLLERCND
jgi:hypothetical protein